MTTYGKVLLNDSIMVVDVSFLHYQKLVIRVMVWAKIQTLPNNSAYVNLYTVIITIEP